MRTVGLPCSDLADTFLDSRLRGHLLVKGTFLVVMSFLTGNKIFYQQREIYDFQCRCEVSRQVVTKADDEEI